VHFRFWEPPVPRSQVLRNAVVTHAPTSCLSLHRFRRARNASLMKRYGSDNITHNALDINNMRPQIHLDIVLKLTENRAYHSQRASR